MCVHMYLYVCLYVCLYASAMNTGIKTTTLLLVLICWKAGILQLITMDKVYPLHGTYEHVIHW